MDFLKANFNASPDVQVVVWSMNTPLALLLIECQSQIATYKRANTGESQSCVEIVRQAIQGNSAALTMVLEDISKPIIAQRCPPNLYEDVLLEVEKRLLGRFGDVQKPLAFPTFAAYHAYLNVTIQSVLFNLARKPQAAISIEELSENVGSEPAIPSFVDGLVDHLERRTLAEQLLALLPDPLEREVVHQRFLVEETPDEIVETLSPRYPTLTKQMVYRLLERALRRLRKDPRVQHALQKRWREMEQD